MNKQPKIYFAYGSNLNLEDMKVRCPLPACWVLDAPKDMS